jgi:hypothetical protein
VRAQLHQDKNEMKKQPAEKRFLEFVDKNGPVVSGMTSPCWIWNGTIQKGKGYGQFHYKGHTVLAHRFSYELNIGHVPNGSLVCHKCDVRKCVNPNHFFLGSNLDNQLDSISKGRNARGERTGTSKLTEKDVVAIRLDSRIQREVAADYGVSRELIGCIKRRQAWRHV